MLKQLGLSWDSVYKSELTFRGHAVPFFFDVLKSQRYGTNLSSPFLCNYNLFCSQVKLKIPPVSKTKTPW